jgi:hypothetical protein
MGRFMSPDWSVQVEPVPYAKLYDPQSLNLYAYARNNPLTNFDLDGHDCVDQTTRNGGGTEVVTGNAQCIFKDKDAGAQQQNQSSTATTNPNATAEQHQYDLVVNRVNKLLGTKDAAEHIDSDGNLDGGNYAFPINHNDKSDAAFQRSLNKALGETDGDTGAHGGLTPPTHRLGFSTSLHHDNDALHVDHFNGAKFPVGTLLHAIVDVGIGHLMGPNFAFSYSGVNQ